MLIDHRGEDASYFDTMAAKAWSCCCRSATMVIDQRTRLLIVGCSTVLGVCAAVDSPGRKWTVDS